MAKKNPNVCPRCGKEHAVSFLPRAELGAYREVDPLKLHEIDERGEITRLLVEDETFRAYICDDERVIVGDESGKDVTRG